MSYLKNELSKKSKWSIPKHRYLELVHFCLQYPEWKKQLRQMDILRSRQIDSLRGDSNWTDETSRIAMERVDILNHIRLIEQTCNEADSNLANYLLTSVTYGVTFPKMAAQIDIPCGKDMFYDRRRKFFWILDKRRG